MRWDRFFEDLEDQLDSEWEAERAALDSEAERLRLAHTTLRERLQQLASGAGADVVLEVPGHPPLRGRLTSVGVDWCALEPQGPSAGVVVLVPLDAVATITLAEGDLLRSARGGSAVPGRLRERMTFGFVLRDLARRRLAVTVRLRDGQALSGTVDRALADHLDLAVHDVDTPRHPDAVRAVRMVPFHAVCSVQTTDAAGRR